MLLKAIFNICAIIILSPFVCFADDGGFNVTTEVKTYLQDSPTLFAKNDTDVNLGSKASIGTEVMGRRTVYFHPYLTVGESYNDNIMNTESETISDFSTLVSPGIWFVLPSGRIKPENVVTSSYSPGGLVRDIVSSSSFKRYYTYLMAGADLNYYNDYTEENTNDYKVEGAAQLNLKSGISFRLFDKYSRSHDERGTGDSTTLDKFNSNIVSLMTTYDISRKIKLRADFNNFDINYDEVRNNEKDRNDQVYSGYIYYKIRPLISLYTQYKLVDVDYDSEASEDSKDHHFNLGTQWDFTDKTTGKFVVGYVNRKWDNSKDTSDFTFSLQGRYEISPKTSLSVIGDRQINESSDSNSDSSLTNSFDISFSQKITPRINVSFDVNYSNESFDGVQTIGVVTQERQDDFYGVEPSIQYQFRKWLAFNFSYSYSERDSNFNNYDYANNTFMLSCGTGF